MAVVLATLLGLALPGLPFAPAPAGAAPLPMDLDLVSGSLSIRDGEEPASLGAATGLVATVDDATGQITEGTFTAAPLEFAFEITDPLTATVYVDAVFTQITPGAVTGLVTKVSETEATVAVAVDVKVDLHIEVGRPAFLFSDCTAAPVSLRLSSTTPYDSRTGRVGLADADFRVPPVSAGAGCADIIAAGVNERLAGGGHSIRMDMQGEIPNIRIGIHPTTTTLAVTPATTREGDEVTLTASATPGPNAPSVPPAGVVEFRDGATVLGVVPLDGTGTATLSTSSLPVGHRNLTASYQGDETYVPSTSAPVAHLVAAAPTITLPDPIAPVIIGSNPRAVPVRIANPADVGTDIHDARLDVTIARIDSLTAVFTPDRLVVEWYDGDGWEPVPLTTPSPRVLAGTIPGLTVAAGDRLEVPLRLRAPVGTELPNPSSCTMAWATCPGPLSLTATLAAGDGTRTFATEDAPVDLVETARRPTTMTLPGGTVRPHSLRQGFSLLAGTSLGPNFGQVPWRGLAEVYVDGSQVPVRDSGRPFEDGYTDQFVVRAANIGAMVLLPPDIDPGDHLLTVRYLGDPFHAPAEITTQFFVYESAGHPFVCREATLSAQIEWGANMVFSAELPPTAPAGAEVGFSADDVRLLMHRPSLSGLLIFADNNATTPVGVNHLESLSFDLGGRGTASATALSRTGGTPLPASPRPAPESSVDQTYTFEDVTGTTTVSGAPGDVVPVELTEVVAAYRDSLFGFPLTATCTPRGGPMVVGEVEIAGTSVSVSPERSREGTDVVDIEARTFPADAAGTVTFSSDLDGTLGTDVVSGGVASWSEGGLRPGRHVITAAFDATDPSVPDSSGSAEVVVSYSPRTDTEAFVVAARTDYLGSADRADVVADAAALDGGLSKVAYLRQLARSDAYLARVVDGLYQATLGRPADEAGKVFWIGRLRSGWSVAQVTASFYGSGEYFAKAGGGTVESWIDDLYLKLLGRASDADGRAFWVRETGRIGKGTVALRFFQTRESARSRVIVLYDLFLDRAPSRADQDFWATRVIAQGDLALAVELTLSGEYGRRAGNRYPQL